MRNVSRVLTACFVLAMAAPAAAQDHAAGKKVYVENKCSVCHSIAGEGNKKYPLDAVSQRKEDEIRAWLVDAKAEAQKQGKKLALPMKSYKTLPAADLDALITYLRSLK